MANEKKMRLSGIARQLNVGQANLIEFLQNKGVEVAHGMNTIVDEATSALIEKEFGKGKKLEKVNIKEKIKVKHESVSLEDTRPSKEAEPAATTIDHTPKGPKIVGKIDLNPKPRKAEEPKAEPTPAPAPAPKPEPKVAPAPAPKPAPKPEPKAAPQPQAKPEPKPVVTPTPAPVAAAPAPSTPAPTASEDRSMTYDQRMAQSGTGVFRAEGNEKLSGPKILGKIDLSSLEKKSSPATDKNKKNKRKRIKKDGKVDINDPKVQAQGTTSGGQRGGNQGGGQQHGGQNRGAHGGQQHGGQNRGPHGGQGKGGANKHSKRPAPAPKAPVSDEDVQKQIKDTLARLTSKGNKGKGAKYRRDKREAISARADEEMERAQREKSILRLTEFVTVSDLAKMMDVAVTEIITACMNLGLMVSINQRLDAEAIVIVAEEFGYKVEFVSVEIQESISSEDDSDVDMIERPPIVTVMGHVDHGKTSLLDFIRKSNVIAGEAGGITQHIGAYSVMTEDGRRITFLDTPGHEAFTAMRARGAKVTDVAIIIIAADDSVMPQTIEAINHATAAGVPIVFAINKIDKPGANPDKIREQLGAMNYLVEDWGGNYQCQEISARSGLDVDKLLEKVLVESDLLELKANPSKRAIGTVIESTLDKGRGYTSTLLVQAGTLKVGDVMLSGIYTGRVKAMFNERGKKIDSAPPATPVVVLGLNGAPQAGDNFNIMEDDRQAREVANKREQLQRIQGLKTQKHITLDEIGRRIAIGNFQELNIIIKGDVDGSVEALTDSLIKQSKESVQVNVIHKAVGQISESDVLLAAASNAVIIGFQVRPSSSARRIAEKEEIEIRQYSIIYDAINDIKDAIDGMLAPEFKEVITCSVEVMETFKISKVGTIAGCLVREGKINRNTSIRIIRDGIVVYTGKLGSLKRYKDDIKEVTTGMECGLNIDNFNDIKIGDFVEGYEQVEIKRK